MSKMTSAAPTPESYRAWKESIFGSSYSIYHDGLPVENVVSLTVSHREAAVKMLHYGLSLSPPDSHAATALSALGDRVALPGIRRAMEKADARSKVELANAVIVLCDGDEGVKDEMGREIGSVLENRMGHWGERINAAMALREFKDLGSEKMLEEALVRDQQYLVRYHCAESLLHRWGVKPAEISKHNDIFGLVCEARTGDEDSRSQLERGGEALEMLRSLRGK
jgi:hypothetical protein